MEEHKLQLFEYKVARQIFPSEEDKVDNLGYLITNNIIGHKSHLFLLETRNLQG